MNQIEVRTLQKNRNYLLYPHESERLFLGNNQKIHIYTRKGTYLATLQAVDHGLTVMNQSTGAKLHKFGLVSTVLGSEIFPEEFFGNTFMLVSGKHLRIDITKLYQDGCEVTLTDLNSTNGSVLSYEDMSDSNNNRKTDPVINIPKQQMAPDRIISDDILSGGQEGMITSKDRTATALTIRGGRDNNEDGIYVENGQIAVADGMGGEEQGELASMYTLEVAKKRLSDRDIKLEAIFYEASRNLKAKRIYPESGTTVAMARKSYNRPGKTFFELAHVGDAKIYAVSLISGRLIYESKDQSKVQELIDINALDPIDRYASPMRSVITNCVKPGALNYPPLTMNIENTTGDTVVILCSDGVSDFVTPYEILHTVLKNRNPHICAEEIKNLALSRHNKGDGYIINMDGTLYNVRVSATDNLSVAVMSG
jgi:PPM family protein phosphatase